MKLKLTWQNNHAVGWWEEGDYIGPVFVSIKFFNDKEIDELIERGASLFMKKCEK